MDNYPILLVCHERQSSAWQFNTNGSYLMASLYPSIFNTGIDVVRNFLKQFSRVALL